MNTYREVATKARSSSFSSSWAKIRLFDEEEENDKDKEMCSSDANFQTGPPRRLRTQTADRVAVAFAAAIDRWL